MSIAEKVATAEAAGKVFDTDDVLAAMDTVVHKDGFGEDYIYKLPFGDTCVYVEQKGDQWVPSCLIGHVLVELGIPLNVFAGYCGSVSCIDYDLRDAGYKFSGDAIDVMQKAQGIQDRAADPETGYDAKEITWGYALKQARLLAEELKEDGEG